MVGGEEEGPKGDGGSLGNLGGGRSLVGEFQGIGRKWIRTQSLSSVFSRSRILETTRSFGMPYGCSPWKGTAASFFVPWILLPLVWPLAMSVVPPGIVRVLVRYNGRAYVRCRHHGPQVENSDHSPNVRAWGSGCVRFQRGQASGSLAATWVRASNRGFIIRGLPPLRPIRPSFGNLPLPQLYGTYTPMLAHIAFLTYICSRHLSPLLIRSRLAP